MIKFQKYLSNSWKREITTCAPLSFRHVTHRYFVFFLLILLFFFIYKRIYIYIISLFVLFSLYLCFLHLLFSSSLVFLICLFLFWLSVVSPSFSTYSTFFLSVSALLRFLSLLSFLLSPQSVWNYNVNIICFSEANFLYNSQSRKVIMKSCQKRKCIYSENIFFNVNFLFIIIREMQWSTNLLLLLIMLCRNLYYCNMVKVLLKSMIIMKMPVWLGRYWR